MVAVFGINVYIGLYDTNLSGLSPLHYELNWAIAGADIIAAAILFAKPGSLFWKSLAGIVWPIVYVANLIIDVETRLCLGTPATTCSPSVSDAYNYLILGSAGEEWVLWPYTIRVAISLVIIVLVLTAFSILFATRTSRSSALKAGSQDQESLSGKKLDKNGRST